MSHNDWSVVWQASYVEEKTHVKKKTKKKKQKQKKTKKQATKNNCIHCICISCKLRMSTFPRYFDTVFCKDISFQLRYFTYPKVLFLAVSITNLSKPIIKNLRRGLHCRWIFTSPLRVAVRVLRVLRACFQNVTVSGILRASFLCKF